MTPRRLSDDALADALVVRAGSATPATPCPREAWIWEAFQGRLGPVEVAQLLDHAASCADCSLAMRVAQAMGSEAMPAPSAEPAAAAAPAPLGARVWAALAGTVLHPAPALVYLLLLALSFPLYREMTRRTGPPPVPSEARPVAPPVAPPPAPAPPAPALAAPRVVRLAGDLELRGEESPPSLQLTLARGETLLLKVFPDFTDTPSALGHALVVRMLEGSRVVSETVRPAGGLEPDGSLPFLLDGRDLRSGMYRIEARPETAAGTPGDLIFRQTFSVDVR